MKFDQYHISEDIKKNLAKLGFKRPTDIQFKSIPSILKGEDVLAIAQTGTGKTAAFAIPTINKIHSYKSSKRSMGIKCIVLVPTRELALQIGDVFIALSKHTKVKTFALTGGVEQDDQIQKLQDGIDILIATPGRLFDLFNQEAMRLGRVDTLVLDEADYMLDLGFIEDIKYIKKLLPQRHQTLFFSATISPEIKKLAFSQVNSSAIRIQISPKDPVSKNVTHAVAFVAMDNKRFVLEDFIKEHAEHKIVVFVRTRVRAERVKKAMERVDISTITIHGDKEQDERSEVMSAFRAGKCNIMIATDVSARGIDIPDISYVINYDLPDKPENYVHRIGRTGRGVSKGIALSFCSEEEKPQLEEIEAFLEQDIGVLEIGERDYEHRVAPLDRAMGLEALGNEVHNFDMPTKKKPKKSKKEKMAKKAKKDKKAKKSKK